MVILASIITIAIGITIMIMGTAWFFDRGEGLWGGFMVGWLIVVVRAVLDLLMVLR